MNVRNHRSAGHAVLCAGLWAGLALCLLPGCSPRASVLLLQPLHPPAQQRLELTSDWAFFDPSGERQALLLAFPRPGQTRGARDFWLYIETPPGQRTFRIASTTPTPAASTAPAPVHSAASAEPDPPARAFFIQAVGEFRGRTDFVSGSVRLERDLARPRRLRIRLDLQAPDVTLRGRALALADPAELAQFARRYAGDLAEWRTAQPAGEAPAARPEGASRNGTPLPEPAYEGS